MRFLIAALYTALALGATPAAADVALAESLREGTMKKLLFSEPKEVSAETFTDPSGGEFSLADFNGKYAVVNFWATWCAPCRKEMPQLSELQDEFGGDRFEIVTIATGRNPLPSIDRFFETPIRTVGGVVKVGETPLMLAGRAISATKVTDGKVG